MFHNMFWGGMWFGWIFWIIVLVLVFWLIVSSKSKQQNNRPLSHAETPLDILKKRYAKGEITKKQFDQIKKDIET